MKADNGRSEFGLGYSLGFPTWPSKDLNKVTLAAFLNGAAEAIACP